MDSGHYIAQLKTKCWNLFDDERSYITNQMRTKEATVLIYMKEQKVQNDNSKQKNDYQQNQHSMTVPTVSENRIMHKSVPYWLSGKFQENSDMFFGHFWHD